MRWVEIPTFAPPTENIAEPEKIDVPTLDLAPEEKWHEIYKRLWFGKQDLASEIERALKRTAEVSPELDLSTSAPLPLIPDHIQIISESEDVPCEEEEFSPEIDDDEEEESEVVKDIKGNQKKSGSIPTPLGQYIREVSKTPLLSADEEVALSKKIEKARQELLELLFASPEVIAELKLIKEAVITGRIRINSVIILDEDLVVTPEQINLLDQWPSFQLRDSILQRLEFKIKNGDLRKRVAETIGRISDLKKEFILANTRLVISIAKKYKYKGLELLDLIQEGNGGLSVAVERFDYQRGYKFSTYATWWIRQAITRAITDQARTIRVPVHMIEAISKVIKASRILLQELGREPTPEEVSQKLKLPVDKVKSVMKVAQDPLSLDWPMGEDGDSSLGDFIEDATATSPSQSSLSVMLRERMGSVLGTLTSREEKIIRLRFGIGDGCPRTLEEIGSIYSITRERVRQIEAKALKKLRHPTRRRKLESFYEKKNQ